MPSPRNTSLSAVRAINAALALLDQRKNALCAIVESEQTGPEDKYDALVALAHLTGMLTYAAAVGDLLEATV